MTFRRSVFKYCKWKQCLHIFPSAECCHVILSASASEGADPGHTRQAQPVGQGRVPDFNSYRFSAHYFLLLMNAHATIKSIPDWCENNETPVREVILPLSALMQLAAAIALIIYLFAPESKLTLVTKIHRPHIPSHTSFEASCAEKGICIRSQRSTRPCAAKSGRAARISTRIVPRLSVGHISTKIGPK